VDLPGGTSLSVRTANLELVVSDPPPAKAGLATSDDDDDDDDDADRIRGFLCPITTEIMKDPVVLSDGHTYERAAEWLRTHNTSPLANIVVSMADARPIFASCAKAEASNFNRTPSCIMC
jgi:hypothetical protein